MGSRPTVAPRRSCGRASGPGNRDEQPVRDARQFLFPTAPTPVMIVSSDKTTLRGNAPMITGKPKKILMLVGDFTEEYEIFVFDQAMEAVGHEVDIICPDKKAGDIL